MSIKIGVDLSDANGNVNLTLKKPDFAILRLGYGDNIGKQDDTEFLNNVKKCESAGVPWGAYIFSYANTAAHIESEVAHCKRMLRGLKPEYPIYMDCESAELKSCGRIKTTAFIAYFCELMKASGYLAGTYFNRDWLNSNLYYSKLWQYPTWYSRPNTNHYEINAGMIQTGIDTTGASWQGCNNGSGYCDIDSCNVDYSSLIKSQGLNGWTKTTEVTAGNAPQYYTVKRGDTLWAIAVQFSVSVETLKRLNPSIPDTNKIYANQKVRVK